MGHKAWWQWSVGAVLLISLIGLGGGCSRAAWSGTYADVPPEHWAAQAIEALAEAGLSGGCDAGRFCPEMPVTRAQVALLLGRTVYGSGFTPPVPSGQFEDVLLGHPAAGWIEWSVTQGLLGACAPQRFCPDEVITRAQMAVYLLRGLYGSDYSPSPAQGGVFNDVTGDTPAAAWIEQLPLEGLSAGCGQGLYCPQAVVTRAQLAVFLARLREQLTPPSDQDQDGLSDAQEQALGTHPANPDSDADGLLDGAEVNTHHTNPLAADSDGDTFSDGEEIAASTNPNDSTSRPVVTLPPDPASVAPPVDQTVATTVHAATEFLYSGANPIQRGVAGNTIEPKRVAVLRGKVASRDGQPVAGVVIAVLDHPEYGQTLTRADGQFDLAVNGGGLLVLTYQRAGYLPVQRRMDVPWQEYVPVDDVVLIQRDSRVTTIDLTAPIPIQVARGSPVTDQDGSRQATLLIPQGAQAARLMPDGSTQALTTLNLRLTEYTVGDKGPQAMPAQLPPTSAYTYAVELSADEATTKVNGKDLLLSQPVPFYVENFLNFPVGGEVPVGYYDNTRGTWVPYDNGRIVKILSITGGRANLDVDGSGNPADAAALAALGISDAERERLASLYSPGQSLWRVPLTHLSTWDCNWPYGPPSDAVGPGGPGMGGPRIGDDQNSDDSPQVCGSIIECENQVLGERIPLTGTSLALNYRGNRVPGRQSAYTLRIPLSGDTAPASLKRIELGIAVAGRSFNQTFPPVARQTTTFTWDGRDAYGRTLQGTQAVTVAISYVYDAVYNNPTPGRGFGVAGGVMVAGDRTRQEISFSRRYTASLGTPDTRKIGLGGWSLDLHHSYDPVGKVLLLGDGTRQSIQSTLYSIITTLAGDGSPGFGSVGDGGPATQARLHNLSDVAVAPDGSVLIADNFHNRVRRVGPDGLITTFAGNGTGGYSGDGGPATQAGINPYSVAVAPDGSVLMADQVNHRIRRVGPDGVITTFAGNGTGGYSGDGGPATEAALRFPRSVAVAPDGSVLIVDDGSFRIRRVGPDGIITTIAGDGFGGYSGDGGPATQARLLSPTDGSGGAGRQCAANRWPYPHSPGRHRWHYHHHCRQWHRRL